MKKEQIFMMIVLGVILLSFLPLVFGAQDSLDKAAAFSKGAVSGFSGAMNELLSPLFGDREMLTRVFFAILLYMILYSLVGIIFHGKGWMIIIITFLITAISLLALPANFIGAIRTQYGAMGAAILSTIPFIIMLVFTVRVKSELVARVLWLFYCMYYLVLYLYMIITTGTVAGEWINAETIPYIGALLVGGVIFFVIGKIRKALFFGEMKGIEAEGIKVAEKAKLLHKLQAGELEKSYKNADAGN